MENAGEESGDVRLLGARSEDDAGEAMRFSLTLKMETLGSTLQIGTTSASQAKESRKSGPSNRWNCAYTNRVRAYGLGIAMFGRVIEHERLMACSH